MAVAHGAHRVVRVFTVEQGNDMYKLSGLDAGFLYNETERCPQHVSSVQIMELPVGVDEDTFIDGLKALFQRRLHLVPYLTNRLVETPFLADHPVWVPDPEFDIDRHIYRRDVPAPGGRAELEAAVAAIHEERLDRRRPLWRTVVLCGLEDGRIAYYSGAHHACLDGMAGQAATMTLMDNTEEPREVAPPAADFLTPNQPSLTDLFVAAWENITAFQIRQAAGALDNVETAIRLQRRMLDPNAGFGAMAEQAPWTRFNAPVERGRGYATAEMDLAAVKAAGKRHGAKLNDVFLAICGGGLRRYLGRTGELPARSLIAGCPVSLRKPGDASMNNQVTMMQVRLGTDQPDPAARIQTILESSAIAKDVTADLAGVFESDPAAWGMPLAMRAAASVMEVGGTANAMPPAFNVVVSNVPGPRETLYSNGARMLTHYPVSIPAHGLGVNITVQSYVDTLYVGITACAKALPDAGTLRDDLVAEYEALCGAFFEKEASPALADPTPLPVVRRKPVEMPPAEAA
ncbi:MAG: wax ester/triacylglycerol synthase family O-acyltransferase [Gammaproteobacteria bacterium]|nr:wax ester/triacylglycerol synthase family O-acyltransferase [Gammaproteobacteria bacterium]